MLNFFLAITAYIGVMVGLSVLVMIHGWGLQPQSWWWIIGVGFGFNVIAGIVGNKIEPPKDTE